MKRAVLREIPIREIKIPRSRRPLGDIAGLARSISDVGLLNAITVTTDLRLVAGLHRLRECESLGWKKIPAIVIEPKKIEVELSEIDENLIRRDLTVLQRAEALARRKVLYEALHPETRRGTAGGRASGASRRGEEQASPVSFVRDAAGRAKISKRTVERHVQLAALLPPDVKDSIRGTRLENDLSGLLRLARLPPEEQRPLARKIAKGEARTVRGATVAVIADGIKKRSSLPSGGPFKTIVVDPPWPAQDGRIAYPTMSIAKIKALPVAKMADADCVLWLWTTHAFLRLAFEVLDAWGFKEKTMLTWVKNRITHGHHWLRTQTEHALLAVKGSPKLALRGQSNALIAPVREHSRKPEEFYKLVESLCPGPRVELFARASRKGWTTWGGERGKFSAQPQRRSRD